LIFASLKGYEDIVKFLIENGADIDAKDNLGATALMYAVDHLEVVELLIKEGIDVKAKDNYGDSALSFALKKSSPGVISALENAGCKK